MIISTSRNNLPCAMRYVRAMLSVTILLSIDSCRGADSTTGSSVPMTLTFDPASLTRTGTRISNGNLRCDVDMTIVAHGGTDHRLSLQSISSTFRDSTGTVGNTVTSSPIDWFGVSTLKRDETAVAHRQPTGAGPFTLTTSLTYSDQFGASKIAMFSLTCAP